MKQTKVFIIIFVSIFVFTMLSCSSTTKTLKITPKILDFGNVNLSESSTLNLTLTNKYSKDVFITNINLSDVINYSIVSGAVLPINMSKNGIHEISIKYEPASGGVHNAQEAYDMIKAGATRLGASAGIEIVSGKTSKSSY